MDSTEQRAEIFYAGALTRITRTIPVLAVLAVPALLWRWAWPVAAGFALGAVLSIYNFWSLSRAVEIVADHITASGGSGGATRIVALLGLRYGVIALVAYGIFRGSIAALYGLLGGLGLPIAAIGCEAVFELYIAFRRGL